MNQLTKNEIEEKLRNFSTELTEDIEIKLRNRIKDDFFIEKIIPEILEDLAERLESKWEYFLKVFYEPNEYHRVARSWTTGKKHIEQHHSYYPDKTLTASVYDIWLAQNGQEEES